MAIKIALWNGSENLGTAKVLHSKLTRNDCDIDSQTDNMYHLVLPVQLKGIKKGTLWNALDDLYRMSCCCAYDCCGHFTGGVGQVRIKGRHVSFMTSYSRNY